MTFMTGKKFQFRRWFETPSLFLLKWVLVFQLGLRMGVKMLLGWGFRLVEG